MKRSASFLAAGILFLCSMVYAAVPQLINFQGILRDGSGNPVANGSYSVQFTIYDAPSSGNVVWQETQSVSTVNGLFTALLGSSMPVLDSVFNDSSRYLGVKVGTDPEMTPRQKLSSVGFSYVSGQWTSIDSNLYRLNGNVGIGTAAPYAKLDVTANSGSVGVNVLGGDIGVYANGNVGGVSAYGGSGTGVSGTGNTYGVYANSFNGYGVYAQSNFGTGVQAAGGDKGVVASGGNIGVDATGVNYGVHAVGTYGVYGVSSVNGAAAVFGDIGGNFGTYGGYFQGDVKVERNLVVVGSVFKGGGGFKIDHPTDPANKYLYHSFVESPDMKNIYDGVAVTDAKGDAVVTLPEWFGAVNKDFRYQLTVIGLFAQAIISKKIKENRFSIKTDQPNVEVSWQVTGIRKDAYAEAHRIPVEEEKAGKEKGKYLHPTEHGAPASLGMHYEEQQKMAAEREKMKEKQARMEAERKQHEEERAKMEQERLRMDEKAKGIQPNK